MTKANKQTQSRLGGDLPWRQLADIASAKDALAKADAAWAASDTEQSRADYWTALHDLANARASFRSQSIPVHRSRNRAA